MMDILSFKQRKKYNKVVMIQFPKDGNYCLAFVTGETREEVQTLAPEPLVHVYVPTSPNPTSGYFLLVPEREVVSGGHERGRSHEINRLGRALFFRETHERANLRYGTRVLRLS